MHKWVNHLSANLTERLSTFKKFVGNLPTNCLSVFDHFEELAVKGVNEGPAFLRDRLRILTLILTQDKQINFYLLLQGFGITGGIEVKQFTSKMQNLDTMKRLYVQVPSQKIMHHLISSNNVPTFFMYPLFSMFNCNNHVKANLITAL